MMAEVHQADRDTDGPGLPTWLAAAAPPEIMPDRAQAEEFARLLFEGMAGFVNLRAIEEPAPAARKARVSEEWHAINSNLPNAVGDFVERCAADGLAAYLLPHPVSDHGGKLKDILSQRVIPIDVDKGDIGAIVAALTDTIGEPWLSIASGGRENGHAKKHLYFRLATDAQASEFARVADVRAAAAARFGADTKVGNNPAQILRIPGSLHRKSASTGRCELLAVNQGKRVAVEGLARALGVANDADANPFDFSNVVPFTGATVERALTQPTLAEGKSDDGLTRFEAASMALGHFIRMIRTGYMAEAEARAAAQEWNVASLSPAWSSERIDQGFNRLARIDFENHGPVLPPPAPAIPQSATGLKLTEWFARDKFVGAPPAREWLVDGLIPRGTPGVFAAVGDAGKSLMALRLCNIVGSYPRPDPGALLDLSAPRFFGQSIVGRGTAVFLTGEDDAGEVHRRLDGIDPSGAWKSPQSQLIVLPLLSAGGAHALVASGPRGPELTPAWHELRTQLEALPDLALVVQDPLTLFVGGDTNDNAMGAALMGELNQLAAKTGAAVMLIHHFAKSGSGKITGLSDARNAVLGAAAWTNNARWSLVLWEAAQDDAYRTLKSLGRGQQAQQAGLVYFGGLTKGNAPGAKVMRTLVHGAAGVLEDHTDELKATALPNGELDAVLHRELVALAHAQPGFSFTSSPTALWATWGPVIRKLDLPISKEGTCHTDGRFAPADVLTEILAGGQQLWVAWDGTPGKVDAVMTTAIAVYPRRKAVRVVYVAGRNMRAWLPIDPANPMASVPALEKAYGGILNPAPTTASTPNGVADPLAAQRSL